VQWADRFPGRYPCRERLRETNITS
jgi:hypothetical protein